MRRLACAPQDAEAWDRVGAALVVAGSAIEAATAFAEAARLAPAHLGYALRRARAAAASGAAETELAQLAVVAESEPASAAVFLARACLLGHLGHTDEAIAAAEMATAQAPDAPEPAAELARLLVRTTRVTDSVAALRRALNFDPDDPDLRQKLAVGLMHCHRPAEAERLLTRLCEHYGEHPGVLTDLALSRLQLGLQALARATAERAVAAAPADAGVRRMLCNILAYCDGVGGVELSQALRDCGALWPRGTPQPFTNAPDPKRRLRLGLLSGTLWRHPIAWLTIAAFENLDPAQFQIECFAGHGVNDAWTARFQALSRFWHRTDRLGDEALARLIRSRNIDILIDLGGYLGMGRLPVLAYRPAPVQIKWAGAQYHTTGIAEIDWLVTDRWETPPELAPLYSEKLLVMPDSYICYSPPADAPAVVPLPAEKNGFVTFGSCNSLMKITPRVIATWATLMHRATGSHLVLKAPQFDEIETADRVVGAFESFGIRRSRLRVSGTSDHRGMLEQYNAVDLALQPFPYCGGVSVLEGLWMGVPSIAATGESFASRHGLSHLSNLGLADFVAATEDEYVSLALARTADRGALAALRADLRQRMKDSPLCDARGFARGFGETLRRAWSNSVFSVTR